MSPEKLSHASSSPESNPACSNSARCSERDLRRREGSIDRGPLLLSKPSRVAEAPPRQAGEASSRLQRPAWRFEAGAEIAPGRAALKPLGGGSLYEVYLVWDELLHAICVAKMVRPDQVSDEHALSDLRAEAEILERLAQPVIVRGFDAVPEGPHPPLPLEQLGGTPL